MPMYDLLIKGGRVIDPARGVDRTLDVAVSGGKIAAVGAGVQPGASHIIDARDRIVTPGLIDFHCHVYDIIGNGVAPDVAGVTQGVTTVVDGGSAGQAIFAGFPRYVIPSSRTSVFCFLNLDSLGLSLTPEFRDGKEIDAEKTAATIEAYPGLIKGVKVRLVGNLVARDGIGIFQLARKTAGKFGLPVMVHIGDLQKQVAPTLTREVLPLMEPGDVLCHIFTPQFGGILGPDGSVLPELVQAKERGVVLDCAQGRFNFSHAVARKCLAQGILPTTISSDLAFWSVRGPVYGLTVVLSRCLALGLTLGQVIEMSTINPARALGISDRAGSLSPGMDADISILEMRSGVWKLVDTEQQTLEINSLLTPYITIKAGNIIEAQPAARPEEQNAHNA